MHKAKQQLVKAAERIQGMERTKLLIACSITISAALIVITVTLILLNIQSATPKTTDIIVSGEIVCLPHKTTSGPQTLECAFGLKTDDNRFFALQNASQPEATKIGTRITVHGVFRPGISTTYDIVGAIDVASLTP